MKQIFLLLSDLILKQINNLEKYFSIFKFARNRELAYDFWRSLELAQDSMSEQLVKLFLTTFI
jgi:hypothetical protein